MCPPIYLFVPRVVTTLKTVQNHFCFLHCFMLLNDMHIIFGMSFFPFEKQIQLLNSRDLEYFGILDTRGVVVLPNDHT